MTDYKDLKKNMKDFSDAQELVAGANPNEEARPDVRNASRNRLTDIVYNYLDSINEVPDTNRDDVDYDDEIIQLGLGKYSARLSDISSAKLRANLDNIVDKQIPGKTLEKMSQLKEIKENATGDNAQAINLFYKYKSAEDLAKRYKADPKNITKDEAELIGESLERAQQLAIQAEGEKAKTEEIARQKSDGYSSQESVKIASRIRILAIKQGYRKLPKDDIKDYIVQDLKNLSKNMKEAYDNHGTDIKDAVRGTLKELGSSKGKKFKIARSAIAYT
jgi:hypothetical protein